WRPRRRRRVASRRSTRCSSGGSTSGRVRNVHSPGSTMPYVTRSSGSTSTAGGIVSGLEWCRSSARARSASTCGSENDTLQNGGVVQADPAMIELIERIAVAQIVMAVAMALVVLAVVGAIVFLLLQLRAVRRTIDARIGPV